MTHSSTAGPSASALPADRIQILHTNDIHGRMQSESVRVGTASSFDSGGVALLAGLVAQQRARAPDRTLLLDAGDAWQGSFISNANRGAALVQVMDRMAYDAQALGNHDFDWGQDVLRARAGEAAYPFLAANVVDANGAVPAFAKPYLVKDLGIARVAVLGIANPGTPAINKPANVKGLSFLAAAPTVRGYLPELRRKADIVVVLSHLGKDDDVQLARDVPDIDVIVGGHSHTVLQTAVLEGHTTIVQTGSYAAYLGRLEIAVDPATRKVASIVRGNELLSVAGGRIQPDPEVARIVAAKAEETKAVVDRVVGTTTIPLETRSAGEFPLGDVVVDAMLDYCRAQGWRSDLAFHNNSGVRSSIPAGDITYGRVYEVLPFDNAVVSIDLRGSDLAAIFERTVSGRPGNLLIAGGTYAFSFSDPVGSRIRSVTVGGAPLDAARTYRVCTIDYLALGGDDQTTFRKGTDLVYGDLTADVVADWLSAHRPLAIPAGGRIRPQ